MVLPLTLNCASSAGTVTTIRDVSWRWTGAGVWVWVCAWERARPTATGRTGAAPAAVIRPAMMTNSCSMYFAHDTPNTPRGTSRATPESEILATAPLLANAHVGG